MLVNNVGTLDRVIRVVAGVALLAMILFIDSPVRWAGLIGVILVVTGLAGTCPLYRIFGLSTCPLSTQSR